MVEQKHTPGPWEVTDQNGDTEGGFRGVRRPTQTNSLGKPYNMYVAQYCSPADARLIAATPSMLEALKEAWSALEDAELAAKPPEDMDVRYRRGRAMKSIELVLAKVGGRMDE